MIDLTPLAAIVKDNKTFSRGNNSLDTAGEHEDSSCRPRTAVNDSSWSNTRPPSPSFRSAEEQSKLETNSS